MVRRAFAGDGVIDTECRIVRADDGAARWLKSKGEIFFDTDGRPRRAMGAIMDITMFREAEAVLLRRSEDRYRRIVETAQEGIWLVDADAKTSFVNPKMAALLGYESGEMLGRDLLEFMDDEWRAVAGRKLVDRAAGIVETHEFKFRRKDGSPLWGLLSCAPIVESGVYRGALAMVTDFTERKRLESERQRFLEELKQADRRKDEFLATLGHELRTPLATIKLAIDVIEGDAKREEMLGEKNLPLLARMQRQVDHLMRLVEDILQVSRMRRGLIELRREALDLNVLLAQIKDAHQARLEAQGLRLTVVFPNVAVPVHGDSVRLTQVFGNLLDNAGKYTESGGTVDVIVARDAGEAVVTVADSGIGIPPAELSSIFELFHQMKHGSERRREGIGVGLALARKLVDLHGGRIEAQSEGLGKGSAFVVRLPLAARPAPARQTDRAPASSV
jgi:PAS domain S-box-containing protein